MPANTATPAEALSGQWRNPADILSLLLLIGGDIVQKALAQLTGYSVRPFGRYGPRIALTPVAFSFGWVAFGFSSLMSAVGGQSLMPAVENPAIVMNCANSFARENRSWLLDRLLRDHEIRHGLENTTTSMRIDIFELSPIAADEVPEPAFDSVWWAGWLTIAAQIGIALVPWVLYGNWGVMMVLLCGTLLAIATGALPQWTTEKWAGAKLHKPSTHVLTRGNGHRHVMVFVGRPESFNLEIMGTTRVQLRTETPIFTVILALLWACLLICTSGLKENSWFLIGIGGLGMLQNVFAAGSSRSLASSGLKIIPFRRKPEIIAGRLDTKDDIDADVNLQDAGDDVMVLRNWIQNGSRKDQMPQWVESMAETDGTPAWLVPSDEKSIVRTQGALMELEKWVPTAGLALLKIFFPGSLDYEDRVIRDNTTKKFWRRAWHTKDIRRKAEHARLKN